MASVNLQPLKARMGGWIKILVLGRVCLGAKSINIIETRATDISHQDQPSESQLFFWDGCLVE